MRALSLLGLWVVAGCSFDTSGLDPRGDRGAPLEGGAGESRADLPPIILDSAPRPCTPQTCPGCCLDNACYTGDAIDRCGTGAAKCLDCAKTSLVCTAGTCASAPSSCTSSGECAGQTVCVPPTCVDPYGRDYTVTLVSADIAGYWDYIWPWLPDPVCVVKLSGVQKLKTAIKTDTSKPVWNQSVVLRIEKNAPLRIECFDDDYMYQEPIGNVEWSPEVPVAALKAGTDAKGAGALAKVTVTFKPQ